MKPDLKDKPEGYGTAATTMREKTAGQFGILMHNAWAVVHKWGLWLVIALAIGAWIGITVSTKFYLTKMDEVILVGGMVHKGHVFSVMPK